MVRWQAAYTLIKAIEGGDQVAFRVVRDMQLKAQAHAVGLHGALPKPFHGKDGIAGFAGNRTALAVKFQWKGGLSLPPFAVYGFAVWRDFSLEARADGDDLQLQAGVGKCNGAGFDGEDALFQAVEGGAQRAIRVF